MGRLLTATTPVGLWLGLVPSILPTPALARACRAPVPAIPSAALQTFEVEQFDLSLDIPRNYRSMLRASGHITFHDPHSFTFIQCLVRTGEYGEVPPYVALEVHQQVDHELPLVDLIRQRRPWLDYYSPEYNIKAFAGQDSLQYVYFNEIYQLEIANISFFSPDGRTLLTLTGPIEHPIMVNVLSPAAVALPLPEAGSRDY